MLKQKQSQTKKKLPSLKSADNLDSIRKVIKKSIKTIEKDSFRNLRTKELKLKDPSFENQTIKQYLNIICSHSGDCLAFGRETEKISKLFDGFVDFRHLTSTRRVGVQSENGFVLNLEYEVSKYKVNALLKSSKSMTSDNLYYEYLVGTLFINEMNKVFPCFTETYHLFNHKNQSSKKLFQQNEGNIENVTINSCDNLNVDTINDIKNCIKKSCVTGVNYAILVQYIHDAVSIKDYVLAHVNDSKFIENMLCILFQIYTPLAYLKNEFTHYDLHYDNVLLYKLQPGKFVYIKYFDETRGITTTLKTNYIPKIIDYGRAYFGNLGNKKSLTSKDIGDLICSSKIECKGNCGDKSGYNFFEPSENKYHINSVRKNSSHDLRLVKMIMEISPLINDLFKDSLIYDDYYGTKELTSHKSLNDIRNITDMQLFLQVAMDANLFGTDDKDTSVGVLRVYLTKEMGQKKMEFIPGE